MSFTGITLHTISSVAVKAAKRSLAARKAAQTRKAKQAFNNSLIELANSFQAKRIR